MNKRLLSACICNACAISLWISTHAVIAQGIAHPATTPAHQSQTKSATTPSSKLSMQSPASNQSPSSQSSSTDLDAQTKQRVADWFEKYDNIRHAAQMTADEKKNAHKLIMAAIAGDVADKQVAKTMLTSMAARYEQAMTSFSKLRPTPETASLQKAYSQYFKTGHQFFQQYQSTIAKNDSQKALAQFQQARKELCLQDLCNKLQDRQLRKRYNIPQYRWD